MTVTSSQSGGLRALPGPSGCCFCPLDLLARPCVCTDFYLEEMRFTSRAQACATGVHRWHPSWCLVFKPGSGCDRVESRAVPSDSLALGGQIREQRK